MIHHNKRGAIKLNGCMGYQLDFFSIRKMVIKYFAIIQVKISLKIHYVNYILMKTYFLILWI